MRRSYFCAVYALCCFWVTAALAEKPVALVIGNSKYVHAGTLANPVNDASDMAAVLKALRFTVIEGYDLEKAGIEKKIREFAAALPGAEAGVFFYAGHGLQVSGVNYIVPVDAELSTAEALDFEMVRLDSVQRTMERTAKTNILFLDACRNNPFTRSLARALGTRGGDIGRGLAPAEFGIGTLISFSTQPGNVANDGTGRNSPFTGSLVKRIAAPGEDVLTTLTAVRNEVLAATGDTQVPWENHALRAKFYFNPEGGNVRTEAFAKPRAQSPVSEAAQAWADVKDVKDIAILETFREQYGRQNSVYDALAKQRIAALKQVQTGAEATQAQADNQEGRGLTGTWTGTLGAAAAFGLKLNMTLELTESNNIVTGNSHIEISGHPDRYVKFRLSGKGPLNAVQEEQGNPPGGAGSYWCTTGTVWLAPQPDGALRATVEGQPRCKRWTMTLLRPRQH